MTRTWERPAFLFSLALNVAFVALAAVRLGSSASVPRDTGAPADPGGRRVPLFAERWHARRMDMLSHLLQLDAEQRHALDAALVPLGPQMRRARLSVDAERADFVRVLERNDADAARSGARRVARGQAALDSLTAEAMLREMSVLRPEQREIYLRATFWPGPPPFGRRPWRGPRPGLVLPFELNDLGPGHLDARPAFSPVGEPAPGPWMSGRTRPDGERSTPRTAGAGE
jgi:Spy/CpxP family protein refolding chaperone